VLVLGPIAVFWTAKRAQRDLLMVIVLPALAHTIFTVQQQRPLGLRYLLPAIALWIVAASPIVAVVRGWARNAIVIVTVAGALVAASAPQALAWTNPLLGPGYRNAADANFDWGQSYYALKKWTPSHHPWLQYFGSVPGIDGARSLAKAPANLTGWVAISASDLTMWQRKKYAWLRAYCPVRVLNETVLLYYFPTPPDQTLRGPAAPARVCKGKASTQVTAAGA
jgi:hypothetical protein